MNTWRTRCSIQCSAGKSHARHSTGLQLPSHMPAGLPWTRSVALGLFWAEKDPSYGIRHVCTDRQHSCCGDDICAKHQSGQQDLLAEHKDLCRSPQQTSKTITSRLLPGCLSCACHSGQTITQEKSGRHIPKRGERLHFSLW